MHKQSIRFSLVLIILALVSLACNMSSPEQVQSTGVAGTLQAYQAQTQSVDSVATGVAATLASIQGTSKPGPQTSTDTPGQPTAPPGADPVQPATAAPLPLTISEQGFGQEDRQVAIAFKVTNPNPDMIITNSQYQYTLVDSGGGEIMTEDIRIYVLLPGQTLGISRFERVDAQVGGLELQVTTGEGVPAEVVPEILIKNTVIRIGPFGGVALGELNNPYDQAIEDATITALLYDSNGNIVGGGIEYPRFIPAGGSTGAQVEIAGIEDAARVEMYTVLSEVPRTSGDSNLPIGSQLPTVDQSGFAEINSYVRFGFRINNPNTEYAILNSLYQVTAYSGDGSVLSVVDGIIGTILPDSTIGIANAMPVNAMVMNETTIVDRIQVDFLPGEYRQSETLPELTASNITLNDDDPLRPFVTADITNPYAVDFSSPPVYILVYDEQGEIIGNGMVFPENLPANQTTNIENRVYYSGTADRVEIYTEVRNLSDISE